MKKFFVLAAFSALVGAPKAYALDVTSCMSVCSATVTVDSGHGAAYCDGTSVNCGCAHAGPCGGGMPWAIRTPAQGCQAGYAYQGSTVLGNWCCIKTGTCPPQDAVADEEAIASTDSLDDIASAFQPDIAAAFWGEVDGVNRSPTSGRANSIHTRVDICMGATDIDSVTASGWNLAGEGSCETYCGLTSKNEYCNANGAAVCKDRCACLYQYNGVGSLTCNNL
jgi:hypothetical protein